MARKAKVQPTHLTGKKPLKVALHDVIRALKMIEEHKLTDKFVRAAKKSKAFVSIGPDTVNFVKDFLANNHLQDDPVAKHIINARGPRRTEEAALAVAGDRFDCDFGTT